MTRLKTGTIAIVLVLSGGLLMAGSSSFIKVKSFQITCAAGAATKIQPSGWFTTLQEFRCHPLKANPDDSAECACIGDASTPTGAGNTDDDGCYAVGGCANAEDTVLTVPGSAYCVGGENAAVVLSCIGGGTG